jgi:hypothetical protein
LVERGRSSAGGSARVLEPRLDRLKRHTGIELAVDIRELVVTLGGTPRDWLIVVGGKFPKQDVVKGLHTLLQEEGVDAQLAPGERRLTLKSGAALGQADDGALLFASSGAGLDGALGSQPSHELGLGSKNAAALAATQQGASVLPAIWPGLDATLPADLRVQRVTGELALAAVPALRVDVRLAPAADVAAAEARLGALIASAPAGAVGQGANRQMSAPEGLRVRRAGEAELRIEGPWPRESLDRALESLGVWLAKSVVLAR